MFAPWVPSQVKVVALFPDNLACELLQTTERDIVL